jgi:predicted dehydrogenase
MMSQTEKHESMDRRKFLAVTGRTALGIAARSTLLRPGTRAVAASDKLVVGIMGLKGRGLELVEALVKRPDVEIAYLCDVDQREFKNCAKAAEGLGKAPQQVGDFRRILDDKHVDALFNATPDHWHALPTIMACQAGKDVYVEKPAAHDINEGRKMVEAARKYNRIVQMGNQTRSAPYAHAGIDYLRSGKLGDVHLVRVVNMKLRPEIGHKKDAPVPAGVDYDMWLGAAPLRPFNPNRFHYCWHWFWDYSGGDIINDAVHQIDLARWIVGQDYPESAVCTGIKTFNDDQETPDTQSVQYAFKGLTMTFECALWTPYMKKTTDDERNSDVFPAWTFNSTRVEVYGTKGLMMFGRQGDGWQVYGPEGKVVAENKGRDPVPAHLENFFVCVKSRKAPNAEIESGHLSTNLAHLGNISYRLGGRRIMYDGKNECFVNDEQANSYIKRVGRAPWAIPDKV